MVQPHEMAPRRQLRVGHEFIRADGLVGGNAHLLQQQLKICDLVILCPVGHQRLQRVLVFLAPGEA